MIFKDEYNNTVHAYDVEETLKMLNDKINPTSKMYAQREYFSPNSLERFVSSILMKRGIRNANLMITDRFFQKYFTGLDVLPIETDNYDFDGNELPPSFFGKIIYNKETFSEGYC